MDDLEVARRFKSFRDYLGKSGPKLAEEMGVSKQTISAIEAEGRGMTRERIQQIADLYHIDARYWFGQIEDVKDADIGKRGDDPSLSQIESLEKKIEYLTARVRPTEKLDPVAERVVGNRALHDLVEMVQFWDATMLRRFQDIAYGFVSGSRFEVDKRARGTGPEDRERMGGASEEKQGA